MSKSLAEIEQERRAALDALDELDRQKRKLNHFEHEMEDLYETRFSSLRQLQFLPLSSNDVLNLERLWTILQRDQDLIFSDVDEKKAEHRRQERQVEDKIDQLNRDYRLKLEDDERKGKD